MRRSLLLAVCLFLSATASSVRAQDVDFQRDIRPILSNRCFKCHGPGAKEGGLQLHEAISAYRRAIIPGNLEASRLVKRITSKDEDERMPPAETGDPLTPQQVEAFKKWIAQGAKYAPHWAFQKPVRATPPKVKAAGWARNPIDSFILARLEKEGLSPSPEADRATLIRRVSLDLIGLLPSPKEVEDFVNDKSPDAYEKLVDRLLASPHYGERQARHWLDLARYADSNGYTIDGKRSIWPWRDWVIAAFNKDLPFDRFTIEQIAGDMLPNATRDQMVATGFHRNTSFNEEGGTNPEQFRVERVVDRTNTTGAVWLGLTIGCAQCHTHKYDPITHKEYYQFYAFLNSCDEPKLPLPTPEQEARLRELNAAIAKAKSQPPPKPKSNDDLEQLLADLEKETNGGWRVCYPKMMTSEEGAMLGGLEDRSVLASGTVGPSDTYVVHSVAPETGIVTAVRLEALTHPSLPSKGPGRASNGNFVLSQLVFETDGVPHKFRKAVADHSQPKYDANDAIKGDLAKGWAVNSPNPKERNVDRQALFFLDKPYQVREGQAFVFTLKFSEMPKGYPLGRFRLAVTFASERVLELPLAVQQIVFMDREKRSPRDMTALQESLTKTPAIPARVADLQKQIKSIEARIDTTLTLKQTAKSRRTHIQKRGDFLDLGEAVLPGTLAALHPLKKTEGLNRLDLAHWLISTDNPLTPRVFINRMWQQYFGKGIVETENDFGFQGTLPTHPELLDWLAVEFMHPTSSPLALWGRGFGGEGWSMKRMHKLIVTSATYRQSSKIRSDLKEKDPQNKLLARQHRLRLDAEIIRDAALSASGLFNRKIGGPGVYPPQPPEIFAFTQNNQPWPESKGPDRYRRGMYTFIWRQSQHPLLTTFDAPDAQTACTRRNRSNTPLQALHLANDPTFVEIAKGLADRIGKEGPKDNAGRIGYGFKLCYCREPNDAEQSRLLQYLEQQRGKNVEQAWTMVARVLLNLDEFITRE
ncbi:MAG: PSD1 and planctomycete cytochrome C domain-containing protein [Gemmataceae bacterium]|nr:PSD1 and planctomycete cytochrome C domain-containing protein [Gemmataceae bacterium]